MYVYMYIYIYYMYIQIHTTYICVCLLYTVEYYSSPKNDRTFAIGTSMDGLGEHYTEWNKSDRESQIVYTTTYMWNLKNISN